MYFYLTSSSAFCNFLFFQVCGEHRESGILQHGCFASRFDREGLAVNHADVDCGLHGLYLLNPLARWHFCDQISYFFLVYFLGTVRCSLMIKYHT